MAAPAEEPPPPPAHQRAVDQEDEGDLAMCRICFSADGEDETDCLLSPCSCIGSARFIHAQCLGRWQRSVLRAHSERPARPMEDDRHLICSVCKIAYTVAAPTREALLAEDLGTDICDPIGPAALLVARQAATNLPPGLPLMLAAILSIKQAHWRQSVYLIIDEISAEPEPTVGATAALSPPPEPLSAAAAAVADSPRAGLPSGPAADGSAAVHAVNVTRWLSEAADIPAAVAELVGPAAAAGVTIRHHNGGPVKPKQLLATCLVPAALLDGCPWAAAVQRLALHDSADRVLVVGLVLPVLAIAELLCAATGPPAGEPSSEGAVGASLPGAAAAEHEAGQEEEQEAGSSVYVDMCVQSPCCTILYSSAHSDLCAIACPPLDSTLWVRADMLATLGGLERSCTARSPEVAGGCPERRRHT